MLKFLNLQPEIFGLDVNDSSLKIIKLKKSNKSFVLTSFSEVKIKPGIVKEGVIQDKEALINIIRASCKTVKGKKLDTNYVSIALPEEKSFFQVIQMPKMTEEELKSAVQFEAENYIPLTIDEVYLDFQIIGTHKDKDNLDHSDLLISVMPKPIVDSYVYCSKQAGLVPFILEVESQAIVRALTKKDQDLPPTIFIDLGQNNTSFIIFSGDSIRFTCSLSVYSEQFTQVISKDLGINMGDAEKLKIKYGLIPEKGKNYNIEKSLSPVLYDLVSQIKKYIAFYKGHAFHGYSSSATEIKKIILSGGGANLKGITEFLYKELKLPVEIGNPLINIMAPRNGVNIPYEKALSFTTAIGLALRGANNENS